MHYWVRQASPTHFTIRPRAQAPWAGKPRPTCLSYFFLMELTKHCLLHFFILNGRSSTITAIRMFFNHHWFGILKAHFQLIFHLKTSKTIIKAFQKSIYNHKKNIISLKNKKNQIKKIFGNTDLLFPAL
jgi:hypothetical protein